MFSSLLRRPRPARRRVRDLDLDPSASPSFGPSRRPTADFTEADDDDDDEEANERDESHLARGARFADDDEGDDEDDNNADDDDEDGRPGALPVLPLFSSSHLGSCIPHVNFGAFKHIEHSSNG